MIVANHRPGISDVRALQRETKTQMRPENKLSAGLLVPQDVQRLLEQHFPQLETEGKIFVVENIAPRSARLRMRRHESQLRPGGTVSGPALFRVADLALYVALLGELGEIAIPAVTANLNINFLAKPEPADVVAEAKIMRLGKRLAVGEVAMFSDGGDDMIAHATGTYALPTVKR